MQKYEDTIVNRLAKEVAKTFGGTHVPVGMDGDFYEYYAKVEVKETSSFPAYAINLYKNGFGSTKDKVEVDIAPLKIDPDVNRSGLPFPRAGFNINRDFQALCSGISKRVVNCPEALAALKEYQTRLDALNSRRQGLEGHMSELKNACPSIQFSTNYKKGDTTVRIFSYTGNSANGTLYSDGFIAFDYINSINMDKAQRILNILAE